MRTVVKLNDWQQENQTDNQSADKLFLTEKQIRTYPQFKDATDEEVVNIIITLHQFARNTP